MPTPVALRPVLSESSPTATGLKGSIAKRDRHSTRIAARSDRAPGTHELAGGDDGRPGAHALRALYMPGLGGGAAPVRHVDDGLVAVKAVAGGGLDAAVGGGAGGVGAVPARSGGGGLAPAPGILPTTVP